MKFPLQRTCNHVMVQKTFVLVEVQGVLLKRHHQSTRNHVMVQKTFVLVEVQGFFQ